ncbi:MAG: ribose 5-phosphate isomerase B [Bacilli bacterium]|nr:ribose 5-phosphate isomerase B [Bacilli bacterium]MBN2696681.1 ribose 5-phosphate isomerase B [Bacilli bacterium]
MKIAIGSDHAGFAYKEPIIELLRQLEHEVFDLGTNSETSTDYPVYAFKVGEAIRDKIADLGILICGTGIGVSIAANKVKGVRAGACQSEFAAKMMREHNDANILCLGSRINTLEEALNFVKIYLQSEYSAGPRHQRRIDIIYKYEEDGKWEK